MWRKFFSRKFLVMVATIAADIAIGLGYDVDLEVVLAIAGGIAAIYIAIEGAIDHKAVGEK